MFEHNFQPITHWKIGPIRNHLGWIFSAAEIGDTWFLKWKSPWGEKGISLFSSHEEIVDAIDRLNGKTNNYRPDSF